MSVLVYSHTPMWEQHHAQSIEIATKLLKEKKKVIFLNCDSSLYSCPANFEHDISFCKKCLLQKERTSNSILNSSIKKINLNLIIKKKKYFFKNIDDIYNYKYDGQNIGQCVLSTLVTDKYKSCYLDLEKNKKDIYNQLDFATSLYERAKKIIKEERIKTIYIWNGRRSSDAPFILAAQSLNVNFYTYISGGRITEYICQQTPVVHDLDFNKQLIKKLYQKNFKKNKFKKDSKEFFDYMSGVSKKNYAYGYIQFSNDYEPNQKFNWDKTKKKLVIFTSSMWEFYSFGKDWFYINNKKVDYYDLIEKIINNKYIIKNYNIYVRWHPFLSIAGAGEKEKIKKIINSNPQVNHFDPESKANSYALIEFSDYVLTFGSTVGVEATYHGRPSILFGRAYYEDCGAAYVVKNMKQLINILKAKPKAKKKINAMKYGYWDRNRGDQKFKYVIIDKKLNWYLNGKRIKHFLFIPFLKRNIVNLLDYFLIKKIIFKILKKKLRNI